MGGRLRLNRYPPADSSLFKSALLLPMNPAWKDRRGGIFPSPARWVTVTRGCDGGHGKENPGRVYLKLKFNFIKCGARFSMVKLRWYFWSWRYSS